MVSWVVFFLGPEESFVAKGKDKSRRRHGYKVPPSDNAESFNLQHMGVTLTGITRIKGPTNKVGGNAGGVSAPEWRTGAPGRERGRPVMKHTSRAIRANYPGCVQWTQRAARSDQWNYYDYCSFIMEKSLQTMRKRKVRRHEMKFKWDSHFCHCFVHIYKEEHISLLLFFQEREQIIHLSLFK